MPEPKERLAGLPALAVAPLAPPETTRWSARRKASVVLAVRSGIIGREEAYRSYSISPEEFAEWEAALDRHGVPGLRSTRQQSYRRAAREAAGRR